MNRDNVLYLVIGGLIGFIAGYVLHEAMAARQPAPARAMTAAAAPSPGGAAAGGGGPVAPEVQQLGARLAENPNDAEALRRLGNLNYDISNWQRAAELYERYLALEPGHLGVRTDLGATYRQLGRPEEALAQFRGVREIAPDHWQALYNEILVHAFDLGDLETARSAMAELQQLQPDNPDVTRLAAELQKRSQGA